MKPEVAVRFRAPVFMNFARQRGQGYFAVIAGSNPARSPDRNPGPTFSGQSIQTNFPAVMAGLLRSGRRGRGFESRPGLPRPGSSAVEHGYAPPAFLRKPITQNPRAVRRGLLRTPNETRLLNGCSLEGHASPLRFSPGDLRDPIRHTPPRLRRQQTNNQTMR